MKRTFRIRKDAETRRADAVKVIKALVQLEDVSEKYRKRLVSLCLWRVTQAEGGKYQTRFRSQKSLDCQKKQWQHEHVFRRKKMVDAIFAKPEEIDKILKDAVGCVVTRAEHKRLSSIDKEFPNIDGWERYDKAQIRRVEFQPESST